ncbi:hypothetical protein FRC02_003175 [Tulasnella sp. 418]|nr:hypothetical protein FRC02_003175 [Tulasnella sp. 418]
MRAVISDLVDQNAGDPNKTLATGISGAAGVTGLVGAVMPPGALIVGPIAAVAALAVWARDVYKQTPGVVRCLMGYIVDLTLVMRQLFWKMRKLGGIQSLPEEVVYKVLEEFQDSPIKRQIHAEIRAFVSAGGVLERTDKDKVLSKVVTLITKYDTDPQG